MPAGLNTEYIGLISTCGFCGQWLGRMDGKLSWRSISKKKVPESSLTAQNILWINRSFHKVKDYAYNLAGSVTLFIKAADQIGTKLRQEV